MGKQKIMTRLSMSSTDGQTSKSSKLIYGGVTTVLVVGTALICYYRGKKAGETVEKGAAKVSQETAIQAAVAQEKSKSPAALNFVMLDDNATKLRTAMLGSLAMEDNASTWGMSSTARQGAINHYNQIFAGETVYNSEKMMKYLKSMCEKLAIDYNAQLAKIKANEDPLLNAQLAAELEALPNPVSILEQVKGIREDMGTQPALAVTGRGTAEDLKANLDARKVASEFNQKLDLKKFLNQLKMKQAEVGESVTGGDVKAVGVNSWYNYYKTVETTLGKINPVPAEKFKLVDAK